MGQRTEVAGAKLGAAGPESLHAPPPLGPHRVAARASRHGIAVCSPPPAPDAARGGPNGLPADLLGIRKNKRDRGPLRIAEPRESNCQLGVFDPEGDVDR